MAKPTEFVKQQMPDFVFASEILCCIRVKSRGNVESALKNVMTFHDRLNYGLFVSTGNFPAK